jgi:hypothetical protein
MPTYVYTAQCGHEVEIIHPMNSTERMICKCGLWAWKKPQPVRVNWQGLPPSAGELSPAIQQHINQLPESRDKFTEVHEIHEQNSSL